MSLRGQETAHREEQPVLDPFLVAEQPKPKANVARIALVVAAVLIVANAGLLVAQSASGNGPFDNLGAWLELDDEDRDKVRAERFDDEDDDADEDDDEGGAKVARSPKPPPGGAVPKETTTGQIGSITVVDIGYSVSDLASALGEQRALAEDEGERLLVMTIASPCVPCDGVGSSLDDPLMQSALDGIRLVRVDLDVFARDLDRLQMQRRRYPGYFLLAPDLSPRDAIDGGEWGEDIAENIAPVLGPFVRGEYDERRYDYGPFQGDGIRL